MIVKAQTTILAGQAVTIRPIRKSDAAMETTFIRKLSFRPSTTGSSAVSKSCQRQKLDVSVTRMVLTRWLSLLPYKTLAVKSRSAFVRYALIQTQMFGKWR